MAEGRLTTHVLDTARGCPAAGVVVELFRLDGAARAPLARAVTGADGRTAAPLLAGEAFVPGTYELVFHAGDYLRASGQAGPGLLFLDRVPVRVGIAAAAHYHVPLLLAPHGYTTYRGS